MEHGPWKPLAAAGLCAVCTVSTRFAPRLMHCPPRGAQHQFRCFLNVLALVGVVPRQPQDAILDGPAAGATVGQAETTLSIHWSSAAAENPRTLQLDATHRGPALLISLYCPLDDTSLWRWPRGPSSSSIFCVREEHGGVSSVWLQNLRPERSPTRENLQICVYC